MVISDWYNLANLISVLSKVSCMGDIYKWTLQGSSTLGGWCTERKQQLQLGPVDCHLPEGTSVRVYSYDTVGGGQS